VDRATAIGNVHKKIGEDRTCGSEDVIADRQTHRQTEAWYREAITVRFPVGGGVLKRTAACCTVCKQNIRTRVLLDKFSLLEHLVFVVKLVL